MKLIKYKINPKYKDTFEEFVLNIKEHFKKNTQTIHKARNELKIIKYNNIELVVKAFKIPNIVNQFAYSYIRNSKAKKSFINAMTLMQKEVNSPSPIAYIEFYEKNLLKESFFISLNYKHDFLIREPLYEASFENREEIIKQFTSFTYSLHKKDIFHKDYSAGNTLVKKTDDNTYEFSIVDINRMEFKTINLNLAMQNFNKLWANETTLELIAKEYSKVSKQNEKECVQIILEEDKKLKDFVLRRRKIKAFFKGKK